MTEDEVADAWRRFKVDGDLVARADLIVHFRTLAAYAAVRVGNSLPATHERDDLTSYATIGLIDAIEKYDLERGVKFVTYALPRVRGAIIDEVRSLDWVPRAIRTKSRELERSRVRLEENLGRAPEDHELADHLGLSMEEFWALTNEASIASVTHLTETPGDTGGDEDRVSSFSPVDAASAPHDIYETTEVVQVVARAVDRLPEADRQIIYFYYLQEMTLAEIGDVLGVTESRVCQLQGRVLASLRDVLAQGHVA